MTHVCKLLLWGCLWWQWQLIWMIRVCKLQFSDSETSLAVVNGATMYDYVTVSCHRKLGIEVAHKWLHCCAMVFFFLLSPHPADPTLTTENLMEVVRGVESRWKDLGKKLCSRLISRGVRHSEMEKIRHLYQSDHQKMEAIIKHYVRYYPFRSWKDVSSALERMNLPQLAEAINTKYVRGMWQGWPLASGGYLQMCNFLRRLDMVYVCVHYVLALDMITFLSQQPRIYDLTQ